MNANSCTDKPLEGLYVSTSCEIALPGQSVGRVGGICIAASFTQEGHSLSLSLSLSLSGLTRPVAIRALVSMGHVSILIGCLPAARNTREAAIRVASTNSIYDHQLDSVDRRLGCSPDLLGPEHKLDAARFVISSRQQGELSLRSIAAGNANAFGQSSAGARCSEKNNDNALGAAAGGRAVAQRRRRRLTARQRK